MKGLKRIVGTILLGLSVLLYWQSFADLWFMNKAKSLIGYIWLDIILLMGSGILFTIYGVRLILSSVKKKDQGDILDESEVTKENDL